MITKQLAKAINDQINAELWSAYLYLSMSNDAYKKGFKGVSNWFKVQFYEEQDHAMIFMNYLHSQDEKVVLAPIAAVETEWKSILESFEETLKHEKEVTAMINNLCDIASKDNDYAAQNMLTWFVDEQIEEEQSARDLIAEFKMIEGNNLGMFMADKDLLARQYHKAAPLANAK